MSGMRIHRTSDFRSSILISDLSAAISGIAALRVTIAIVNNRIANANALTLAATYRFGVSYMDRSALVGVNFDVAESRGNFVTVGRLINGAKGYRQIDGFEPDRRGNKSDR